MERVRLSALDHIFTGRVMPSISFVFIYKGELDVEAVKRAYVATARRYPGVGGVLVALDDGDLAFQASDEATAIRVTTEETVESWQSCADPVWTELGEPLARARITRIGKRYTALSLTFSHVIADGHGYFLFMSAWAAQVRGQPFPQIRSARSCFASDGRSRTGHGRLDLARTDCGEVQLESSGFVVDTDDKPRAAHPWTERRWSLDEVDGWVRAEAEGLSENDVLSAALWRDWGRQARAEPVTLMLAVDVRRHRKELGPLYFGNASLLASVTCEAAALERVGLLDLAKSIRAAVDAVPPRIDAALAELEAIRGAFGNSIVHRFRVIPRRGLTITNLRRLPLHELDFGVGPPVGLEVTSAATGPACIILPSRDGLRVMVAAPRGSRLSRSRV